MNRLLTLAVAVWIGSFYVSAAARAKDYVLTIGGGPAANSSEMSIEQNVIYFQQVLGVLGLEKHDHRVLFGGEIQLAGCVFS